MYNFLDDDDDNIEISELRHIQNIKLSRYILEYVLAFVNT